MKLNHNPLSMGAGLLFAVLALTPFAATAVAQTGPGAATDDDINRTELNNFDRYLDDHPRVAQDLKNNPNLVNNPQWMSQHAEFREFLQQHAGVREELKENPSQFMSRENRFERNGGDISRGEAARADDFLDNHTSVARELRQNPKLIDDPNYLSKHPQLNEFLQRHPEVKEDWKQHPNAFMRREKQYEKHEPKYKDR